MMCQMLMKMKNQNKFSYLLLLLWFITPCCLHAAIITSGTCGDSVTWSLNDEMDGEYELRIEGKGSMSNYVLSSETPWYAYKKDIKHLVVESGVTSIGKYCFKNLYALYSVDLPEGLTKIGYGAFAYDTTLVSIVLPSSLDTLEDLAFDECKNLEEVRNLACEPPYVSSLTFNRNGNFTGTIGGATTNTQFPTLIVPNGCKEGYMTHWATYQSVIHCDDDYAWMYYSDKTKEYVLFEGDTAHISDNSLIVTTRKDLVGANVIVNDTDGYKCEWLDLKDSLPFYAPFDFSTDKLTYSRVASDSILTFILPASVSKDSLNGTVYQLTDYDNGAFHFEELAEDSIQANRPYLLKVADTTALLLKGSERVLIKKTEIDTVMASNCLHTGTLTGDSLRCFSGEVCYADSLSQLKEVTTAQLLSPFRTVFILKETDGGNVSARIVLGNETTDIQHHTSKKQNFSDSHKVYDLSGRTIKSDATAGQTELKHGYYIINGQKYYIK